VTRLKPGSLVVLVLLAGAASAQQIADTAFIPLVDKPHYQANRGPRVAIDAAHRNFHTADGGYAPFARLLGLDGYRVESNGAPFAADMLARMDVLVIANAMHQQSESVWRRSPAQVTGPEKRPMGMNHPDARDKRPPGAERDALADQSPVASSCGAGPQEPSRPARCGLARLNP
jgi:hypothetical protein